MIRNVGGTDQALRIAVGLLLVSLFFLLTGPLRWFGLIGLVPLVTGSIGWCPAYTAFHISSRHDETNKPA